MAKGKGKKGKGGPACACVEEGVDLPKGALPVHKQGCPKRGCLCGGELQKDGKVLHQPKCTYQRSGCRNYPNLPTCDVCANSCPFCNGSLQFCNVCTGNKCRYINCRDILSPREYGTPAQPTQPPLITAIRKIEMKRGTVTSLPPIADMRDATVTPRSTKSNAFTTPTAV
uniref:Uncharacterized protein n=1 Tax=Eutreptiella gymnastica TaxID=73025 RepID=A0A7S4FTI7_9EUGL